LPRRFHMDKEIEAFRKDVLLWRGARRRGARRYTAEMRARALALLARLRARGLTADGAAKQVGISAVTLDAWRKAPERAGMVPVRLVAETGTQHSATPVRLLSPRGYQVDVADLAAAVVLLRELG
jgi:transposase-like protein